MIKKCVERCNTKDGAVVYTTTYYGLSTDTKPTDAENADAFYEMNTGDVYMFDKENSTWILQ